VFVSCLLSVRIKGGGWGPAGRKTAMRACQGTAAAAPAPSCSPAQGTSYCRRCRMGG
jgi:hypothetical protein